MRRFGDGPNGNGSSGQGAEGGAAPPVPGTGGVGRSALTRGWPGGGAGDARPPGRPGILGDAGLPGGAPTPGQGEQGGRAPAGRGNEGAPAPAASPQPDASRRAPAQAPTPVEAPTPTLPKGGGAIRSIAEKFSANPATGTGGMSIPIATSPGRSGFGPQLAVAYDSGSGNGPWGLGWSLSVPSVGRKTDKGLPQYRDGTETGGDDSDTFVMSGAEDLVAFLEKTGGEWTRVTTTSGDIKRHRYRPRVDGEFALIERVEDHSGATMNVYWEATTKDRVTSVYGKSADARIADPDDDRRVFRWLLEETSDDRGNVIRYEYKAEDLVGVATSRHEAHRKNGTASFANRHLKRILYGNKVSASAPWTSSDFHFEVVLDYGEHDASAPTPTDSGDWLARQDAFSTHRAGFEIRNYRLCRRVLMFHRGLGTTPDPLLVRSTEFSYQEGPAFTYLTRATHTGFSHNGTSYDSTALPAVDFGYSSAALSDVVKLLEPGSTNGLPIGVDGRSYQWVDLDGEGIPGVLTQQGGAGGGGVYYKRNLGQGKLAPQLRRLWQQPSSARIGAQARAGGGGQQLLDVTGDGRPDLVDLGGAARGYHVRRDDETWGPMRPFASLPNVNWSDPSIRFIDLDGDGLADVMMTEGHVYTWWPSKQREGFGAPRRAPRATDENKGPTAVFAEAEQTVFLADMTGDGLTDLVRIRNGHISYWPNLGYGRFGPKVTMTSAPTMAPKNLYSPSRVRLADVDGSGTTDLLYVGADGVSYWPNEAGNGFGAKQRVAVFPGHDALATTDVVDLLGTGTSCLVWSTPLPGKAPQVRYVDLLNSTKPHLLVSMSNNLGLTTTIHYTTSTKWYLEDRARGQRWATRLPFPVQVVDKVEHYDAISKLRFASTYRYRHGYYDPEEREFRGFGYAEQRDAESVDEHLGQGSLPTVPVSNGEMPLAPVVTKTWFHTGAWDRRGDQFDAYEPEWYQPSGSFTEPRLPRPSVERDDEFGETATLLAHELSPVELRQAHRTFAGRMLRQEIYSEDGSADADKPYVVTQQSHRVRPLQPTGYAPYAVFHAFASESLTIQYERQDDDPRIAHELTVEVDALGYVTKSASVAYGRLGTADYSAQSDRWIVIQEDDFFHHHDTVGSWYRHGIPLSSETWEVDPALSKSGDVYTAAEVDAAFALAAVDYDVALTADKRRVLTVSKQRYLKDDLTGPLTFGTVESLALPHQSYGKALTAAMLSSTLANEVSSTMAVDAGYEDLDSDGDYWAKSGTQTFDASAFYLVTKVTDVFGNDTTITYDSHKLFATETKDALDNEVVAVIDYRVLAPEKVTGINGNFTEAEFDDLGRVTKTWVTGKATPTAEGETKGGSNGATTKTTYDLDRYASSGLPARVKTEVRETHGVTEATTRWLTSYSYADGSGNEVMAKVIAEDGDAPELDVDGHPVFVSDVLQYENASPRWVGTGRTVFDNKGNPIKQYEPYFSATEEYEDDPDVVEWGVTPLLTYDPLGRLIRTDAPDGTYTTVDFDPWEQTVHDPNDTAKTGQTWYDDRKALASSHADHKAADKANAHADTPTTTYFDALGRPIVVKAHNLVGATPTDEFHETASTLDVQGNVLEVEDALGNTAMTYTYGMLGQVLTQDSADAGQRWAFDTAAGQPIKWWGERSFEQRVAYDELRRPSHVYMHDGTSEKLIERLYYGEAHPNVAPDNDENLRGRLVAHFDQAGVVISDEYDFKGNLLTQKRQLAEDYQNVVDYTAISTTTNPVTALSTAETNDLVHDDETFTHTFEYDALDRPTSATNPDDTEVLPTYNDAGLLETVTGKVRGSATTTTFVSSIDYDEKGRRKSITYDEGDGTSTFATTAYTYDAHSYRLTSFKTTRDSDTKLLQHVKYVYDAVGNIVATEDLQDEDVYFTTSPSPDGDADYTYDAVYRLIEATGREHEGIVGAQDDQESPHDFKDIKHANNPNGFREYTQTYSYDKVGNVSTFKHAPVGAAAWTRTYTYATGSDQLTKTKVNSDPDKTFTHDAHGNITDIAHLDAVNWDYADQMSHVEISTDQDVYFNYDSSGRRVRKVWVTNSGNLRRERIYLGGFEVWRRYDKVGGNWVLDDERETVHISDDARRICMVETLTWESGAAPGTITPRYRFQLDNHLGTACVETDETGAVISLEEYHPYGTSSYRSWKTGAEVSAKRYRYTGKERDEETGLYYHGARYYAPWLGRWMSADPAGTVDGTNLFAYVRGSPVVMSDPSGMSGMTGSSFNRRQRVVWGKPNGQGVTGAGKAKKTGLDVVGPTADKAPVAKGPPVGRKLSHGELLSIAQAHPTQKTSLPKEVTQAQGALRMATGALGLVAAAALTLETGGVAGPVVGGATGGLAVEEIRAGRDMLTTGENSPSTTNLAFRDVARAAGAPEGDVAFWGNTGEFFTNVAVGGADLHLGMKSTVVPSAPNGFLDTPLGSSSGTGSGLTTEARPGLGPGDVNPGGYSKNCVSCAVATDARLAGREASAMDIQSMTPEELLERGVYPGADWIDAPSAQHVSLEMTMAGPGSRAIVGAVDEAGLGHAFNVINEGGVVTFIDSTRRGPTSVEGYQAYGILFTTNQ
jgi:RHS repeat-associated protein